MLTLRRVLSNSLFDSVMESTLVNHVVVRFVIMLRMTSGEQNSSCVAAVDDLVANEQSS